MSGPGFYIVKPICPDCLKEVPTTVYVGMDGDTTVLSGIEEHKRRCRGRRPRPSEEE